MMVLKKIKLHFVTIVLIAIFHSNTVHAMPTHITDHNTYLTDGLSGLDWMDVTPTINQSYDFISSQFGNGGLYNDWRYASSNELYALVTNFAPNDITNDNAIRTDFTFGSIRPLIQMLGTTLEVDPFGVVNASGGTLLLDVATSGIVNKDTTVNPFCDVPGSHCRSTIASYDYIQHFDLYSDGNLDLLDDTESNQFSGSFLVRQSPVPIPTAVWLFGSGLIGLVGMRKKPSKLSKLST